MIKYLLTALLACSAYAQDYKRVHIVLVKGGQAGITESQFFEILSKSEPKLNEVGVYSGRVSVIGERWARLNDYGATYTRLNKLAQYGERKGFRNFVDAVHFIVSPLSLNGQWYIAGLAKGVCTVGGSRAYSLSNATTQNITRQYSIEFAATGIAHEIGHTLCARHIASPTMMNPNANAYVRMGMWPLEWDEISKKEIE